MSTFININGILFHEGSIVSSMGHSWDYEICKRDNMFRVAKLMWQKTGSCSIGLFSPTLIDHWHDLDEMVPHHQGYWVDDRQMPECFELVPMRVEVITNVVHRGKELKGRKGTYICPLDTTASRPFHSPIIKPEFIFIEMDDDVGGSGCDGLGKKGHCVMVPGKAVKYEKPSVAKAMVLQ